MMGKKIPCLVLTTLGKIQFKKTHLNRIEIVIKYLTTVTKNSVHGSEHTVSMIVEDDATGGTLQKFPHPSKPQCHHL